MEKINACFISYRNPRDRGASEIVQKFFEALETQIDLILQGIPIFYDKSRLSTGDFFNDKMSYHLCRSACMVLIYTPLYFDIEHPYCAREYKTMLDLEQKRLGKGIVGLENTGLIIPVVLRGKDYMPEEIKNNRQYHDFQDVAKKEDFLNAKNTRKICDLASLIADRYLLLCKYRIFDNVDCDKFKFYEVTDINDWLNDIAYIKCKMPGH